MKKKMLKNYQIKMFYEYINESLIRPGITAKFSLMLVEQELKLREHYIRICDELFDEKDDPEYQEALKEEQLLALQFVDRDEQNQPIFEANSMPKITENIVEFKKESEKLKSKYKSLNEKIFNKNNYNMQVLDKEYEVEVLDLPLEEIPDSLPPFAVIIVIKE